MSAIRAIDSPLYRAGVGLHQTITSPLLSGSLLAALYAVPESARHDALQRLPFNLNLGVLKTALLTSLGIGIIRYINRALNSMALNAWRIAPAPGWDWPKEVAVVTGGCSGIGAEVVKRFVARGIKVAIIDVQPLPVDLEGHPGVKLYQGSVIVPSFVEQTAAQISRDLGEPTILVNNAGIVSTESILDVDFDFLEKTFGVNALSLWTTSKVFAPDMIKNNKGHIVNVASTISFVTLEQTAHYSASKAAALAFHEALAGELRNIHHANNVLTTIVHPTFVETPLIRNSVAFLKKTGLIVLTPKEVADQIVDQVFARRGAQLIIPQRASGIGLFRALPNWIQIGIKDLFSSEWALWRISS